MSVLGAIVLVTALGAAPEPTPAPDPLTSSPNVQFRVLEPKPFPDALRHELTLQPFVPQIGSTFTTHWLTSFTYTFHATEWLGLRLQPFWVWHAARSRFSSELLSRVRQDAAAPSSVMLQWGAIAAPEWSPVRGKFAAFGGTVRYGLVLFAGAGVGGTEIELKTADSFGPATYGSTGVRMVVTGGAGFRAQFGDRWTVRLEVQDLIHWGSVSRINGCDAADLQILSDQRNSGGITGTGVSGQCNAGAFQGTTSGGYDRSNDVGVAQAKVNEVGTDTLHVVGVYLGFGVQL
ncbi:MAG TPA: hypothetical protein VFN45_00350 [Myxococcaceae bacterium]|nr:hypothetical protein [Myxococcaceae bacterium]